MTSTFSLVSSMFVWLLLLTLCSCGRNLAEAATGKWEMLNPNIGISAMHMQLLNGDKVVMYDRLDFGDSNISMPAGQCKEDTTVNPPRLDCTAHSVEYDIKTNAVRPLVAETNFWCSSGSVHANGSLVQTGGNADGDKVVRVYTPGGSGFWEEIPGGLLTGRWYPTNHILPDGRQIIVGGRRAFNYEFYPKVAPDDKLVDLPFLAETNDNGIENNLYPFVFLNVDGNLFIFANNRAILYDYKRHTVVKNYPVIPGGQPRNYPSTGSAVLLPLKNLQDPNVVAEVLVCGGTPKEAYESALKGKFLGALDDCGRISINDPNPQWTMEKMPMARLMSDMVLLPDGNVLIVNGGAAGAAAWEIGRDPVLTPVLYRTNSPPEARFEVLAAATRPRMYHSTAVLLRDARVLIGGSNPHDKYSFSPDVLFPTDLSLEAFSPPYLDPEFTNLRPKIVLRTPLLKLEYNNPQKVVAFALQGEIDTNTVRITMYSPAFSTHSCSMNQRILQLTVNSITPTPTQGSYEISFTTPPNPNFAPAGYYILFVVHKDIPSEGVWVLLQ